MTPVEELELKIAVALARQPWEDVIPGIQAAFLRSAHLIRLAIEAAGLVVVPKVATDEMFAAARRHIPYTNAYTTQSDIDDALEAAIAASPYAQKEQADD